MDWYYTTAEKYHLAFKEGELLGAFGFDISSDGLQGGITWVMICPESQGTGIGKMMMAQVFSKAKQHRVAIINIAASHLSAPFFSKFAAQPIREIPHGWGQDMHRIDMEIHLDP